MTNIRQAEFLAGRFCGLRAMKQLGYPNTSQIIRNKDRSPNWPKGLSGSISHSLTDAIAVTANKPLMVGIDIEPLLNIEMAKSISDDIANQSELNIFSQKTFELAHTIIYSAKESLFKLLYPQLNKMLDFNQAEIMNSNHHQVQIAFYQSNSTIRLFSCHYRLINNQIVTMVTNVDSNDDVSNNFINNKLDKLVNQYERLAINNKGSVEILTA